jgi:hypothetical protein
MAPKAGSCMDSHDEATGEKARRNAGAREERVKAKIKEMCRRMREKYPKKIARPAPREVLPNGRMYIPLTRGYAAIIDTVDYPLISGYRWRVKTSADKQIYAIGAKKKGDAVLMHRLITGAPADIEIDHRDCDGLHNWRSNLRIATRSQNARNRRALTPVKGASFVKERGQYRAQIMFERKKINLGNFSTAKEAGRAYDAAAIRLFGEFARTNSQMETNGDSWVSGNSQVVENMERETGIEPATNSLEG